MRSPYEVCHWFIETNQPYQTLPRKYSGCYNLSYGGPLETEHYISIQYNRVEVLLWQ